MAALYFLIFSACSVFMFLGQETLASYVQAGFAAVAKARSDVVQEGAQVTVHYYITPLNDSTMTITPGSSSFKASI